MQNGRYMSTHLTLEEIEKYLDTSDMSEEYLLWMEQISTHVENCEICWKRIDKVMISGTLMEEDNFGKILKLAQQEEEIRRNILICKLYQMSQDNNTKEEVKQSLMQVMEKMHKQAIQAYIFQIAAMQRRAGVARGEEVFFQKEDGLEIFYDKKCLHVYYKDEPTKKFTAVLNCEGRKPKVSHALWVEEKECFAAQFELEDPQTKFEIYLIP